METFRLLSVEILAVASAECPENQFPPQLRLIKATYGFIPCMPITKTSFHTGF